MKRPLLFCLLTLVTSVFAMTIAGCSKPEEPKQTDGYYDGKMTPAGAKAKKGGAE